MVQYKEWEDVRCC